MTDRLYVDRERDIIYAADIGSSHITLIAGMIADDGKLKILGMERELCRGLAIKGLLDNSTEAASRLVKMSKQLKNRIGAAETAQYIFVSIGGKELRKTQTEVERNLEPTNHVTDKVLNDMEEEARRKFENAYPNLSVAEVIWGTFYLDNGIETDNPVGSKTHHIHGDYELYFGPREMRKQWDECFTKQDQLKLGCYFVSTEALRSALLNSDDEQEGCAIISFGSDTTTYCAYHHGQLLDLCVVPFGSHNITKDIAYKTISITDAEKLKKITSLVPEEKAINIRVDSAVEPGEDVYFSSDQLNEIATVRENEILKPILKSIEDNIDVLEGKTLYITGGGAQQKGLAEHLQSMVDMNVRIGRVSDKLTDDTDEKYYNPKLSQAVGTLLLGAEYNETAKRKMIEKKQAERKKRGRSLKDRFKDIANNLFEDNQDLKE